MSRNSKGQFIGGERKVNQFGYSLHFTDSKKECRKCLTIKPHLEFHKDSTNKYGLSYWCKDCACSNGRLHHSLNRANNQDYKEKARNSYIKSRFGITLAEYLSKLDSQDSKCSICKTDLPRSGHKTHLDHNHKNGQIREFLCTNCNRGLGHFQDNPAFLQEAINYLTKHNNNVDIIKGGT